MPKAKSPTQSDRLGLPIIEGDHELAKWLADKKHEGKVVRTRLKASERVIARVTDGIYRRPASALRELISNAWDADANTVTILTDAPRFAQIHVRDDGAGMSHKTLARLLHHIGSSSKRQEEGQSLGVTAEADPDYSPKGRLLIGKIGIGLFSVSQIARKFRLITKAAGTNYRLVAEIRLRTYSEDGDNDAGEADDQFVTGDVLIKREHTDDFDAHGTDVILDEIKPPVRDVLRSASRWLSLEEKQALERSGDEVAAADIRTEPPQYHSGWISKFVPDQAALLAVPPNLPWQVDDPADVRMQKLMEAVSESNTSERPELAMLLDTYLEMMWTLALSVPVDYIGKHPFDLTTEDQVRLFWLSNEQKGRAEELELTGGKTVRQAVREQVSSHPILQGGAPDIAGGFKVVIDGVELRRPIQFKFARADPRGLDYALLFVGRYDPDLSRVSSNRRGGELELESYLFWNGKIIPKENNGVLVRIRGASGETFDPTFFKYQVSELTRLRQITSEIFVQKGVDAALNIDRESFNFAHPHVQLMANWLHRAIRQLTNRHKELSAAKRELRRVDQTTVVHDEIEQRAQKEWRRLRGSDLLPEIEITRDPADAREKRKKGYIALSRVAVPSLGGPKSAVRDDRDFRAKALVQVLSAHRVFEDMPYAQQQSLIGAIMQIFEDRLT